jgi:hypothetical protein
MHGILEREIAELPHDCSDREIDDIDACICGVLEP